MKIDLPATGLFFIKRAWRCYTLLAVFSRDSRKGISVLKNRLSIIIAGYLVFVPRVFTGVSAHNFLNTELTLKKSLFSALLAVSSIQCATAQSLVDLSGADKEATTQAPDAINVEEQTASNGTEPFGTNLFQGAFRNERDDGVNPNYRVAPGDRITIKIWGAMNFSDTVVVDTQGNIFIPQIGPVRVKGVPNEWLNTVTTRAVKRIFTQNINVYTNLEGTQPVVVYVTGFIRNPGTYAGVASDSLLYFLDRAGGVDPNRGSFREIAIKRDSEIVAQIDLYEFLLEGYLPKLQFMDGDTIVVSRRGRTVTAQGSVMNPFQFEFSSNSMNGPTLIDLAQPIPGVSHATVVGVRERGPVSAYISLSELMSIELQPGDRVVFEADQQSKSMLVRVQGDHLGPSRFSVPVDTRLLEMLRHIEVDPLRVDISAISLRRRSVTERQRRAIEDSLRRLELVVLGATSQTDVESEIRLDEAKLISDFVRRAREVKPEGVLVVSRNGKIQDLLLQPEDIIAIPEKTNVVLVSGAVVVPQALIHEPGVQLTTYLEKVGGITDRGDDSEYLVIRRNLEVVRGLDIEIRPGDEIIVLPKIPIKSLQIKKTIVEVIYQLALTTAIAFGL